MADFTNKRREEQFSAVKTSWKYYLCRWKQWPFTEFTSQGWQMPTALLQMMELHPCRHSTQHATQKWYQLSLLLPSARLPRGKSSSDIKKKEKMCFWVLFLFFLSFFFLQHPLWTNDAPLLQPLSAQNVLSDLAARWSVEMQMHGIHFTSLSSTTRDARLFKILYCLSNQMVAAQGFFLSFLLF